MINTKTYLKRISYTVLSLFFISTFMIASVTAQEETFWNVSDGELVTFNIKQVADDTIETEGTFTLEIMNTAEDFLDLYLSTDLTIDNVDYFANLDGVSVNTTNSTFALFGSVYLLCDSAFIQTFIDNFDDTYQDLEEDYYNQYIVQESDAFYTLKKLSYGWEIKFASETAQENSYYKIQWNREGILTYYESAELDANGKETSLRLSLESYSGSSGGIPGYPSYALIIVGLLSVSALIFRLKKTL